MCWRNADRHGCVQPQHSWPDAQAALRVAETLLRHARRTKTRETVGNKIARRKNFGRIAALPRSFYGTSIFKTISFKKITPVTTP